MRRIVWIIAITLLLESFSFPVSAQVTDLGVDASFNPHQIIVDEDITDYNSMSKLDIQRFLEFKNSGLSRYQQVIPPGIPVSANEIIYNAAQEFKLNPEVMLATLQKEQGLIENSNPSSYQLDWATGYSKCDTCPSGILKYKGFYQQVRAASEQLRYYLDHPEEYQYRPGLTKNTKDGFSITPYNRATAGLYNYTPWRGWTNVNGTTIGGNYLFWKIWNRYFIPELPDNSLVKDSSTGDYYLVQANFRRPFIAKEVLNSLFSPIQQANAQVLPLRKIQLKYQPGSSVTLADLYAASLAEASEPTLWANSDLKYVYKFKNIGSKSWLSGELVLTLQNAAGGPPKSLSHPSWPYQEGGITFKEKQIKPGEIATFELPIKTGKEAIEEVLVKLLAKKNTGQLSAAAVKTVPKTKPSLASNDYLDVTGSQQSKFLAVYSPYQALVTDYTAPITMAVNETKKVKLTIKNTGNVVWKKTSIRLSAFNEKDPGGSALKIKATDKNISPLYHKTWRDKFRVAMMDQSTAKPGETATFTFTAYAPMKEGNYNTAYRLEFVDNQEHRIKIGGLDNYITGVTVTPKSNKKK
ncbi:MAG: hypothetical protein V1707_01990 [bacterium]